MTNFIKYTAIAFAIGMFTVSCNSNDDASDQSGVDTLSNAITKERTQKIIYSVPSPVELANILQKSGSKYDAKILNDINNVSKYSTNNAKALNLGVYGADLAYTSVFNQTQETMFYLKAAQKLADELGITNAFNKNTIDRVETNLSSKDSLMRIISDSYLEMDAYLGENDRKNVSALLASGGWVEGLYLATKVAEKSSNNTAIIAHIADQKLSLENLLGLLGGYPDDENILSMVTSLNALKAIYDKIETKTPENQNVTVDPSTKVATIGSSNEKPTVISVEVLKAITEKIAEIRNSIIN